MTYEEKVSELQEAMHKTKDRRHFERFQAVYLTLQGYTRKEIAKITGRTIKTIYNYVYAYNQHGLAGLTLGHSPGKPPKLSQEQMDILKDTIAYHVPADVGFPAHYNWTLPLVVAYIERNWETDYTIKGASLLLHRLGFSYTRPTYTLKKADPEKQKLFKEETFPALKKLVNEEINRILFEDESMIRDYQAIGCTWFLKGKQRIIPTYGQHKGVKLLGTLNYETGEIFCVEDESYDAVVFLSFLNKILKKYPTGKTVMILDNARIHHAKLIQPFLEEHKDQLELVFLPPYSPQLNLMEGVWKWLKEDVINNVFFSSVGKIKKNVKAFLNEVNQHPDIIIDRLCVRM